VRYKEIDPIENIEVKDQYGKLQQSGVTQFPAHWEQCKISSVPGSFLEWPRQLLCRNTVPIADLAETQHLICRFVMENMTS
jgi:hypothetical protein